MFSFAFGEIMPAFSAVSSFPVAIYAPPVQPVFGVHLIHKSTHRVNAKSVHRQCLAAKLAHLLVFVQLA